MKYGLFFGAFMLATVCLGRSEGFTKQDAQRIRNRGVVVVKPDFFTAKPSDFSNFRAFSSAIEEKWTFCNYKFDNPASGVSEPDSAEWYLVLGDMQLTITYGPKSKTNLRTGEISWSGASTKSIVRGNLFVGIVRRYNSDGKYLPDDVVVSNLLPKLVLSKEEYRLYLTLLNDFLELVLINPEGFGQFGIFGTSGYRTYLLDNLHKYRGKKMLIPDDAEFEQKDVEKYLTGGFEVVSNSTILAALRKREDVLIYVHFIPPGGEVYGGGIMAFWAYDDSLAFKTYFGAQKKFWKRFRLRD